MSYPRYSTSVLFCSRGTVTSQNAGIRPVGRQKLQRHRGPDFHLSRVRGLGVWLMVDLPFLPISRFFLIFGPRVPKEAGISVFAAIVRISYSS